jgi:hypothetical protein
MPVQNFSSGIGTEMVLLPVPIEVLPQTIHARDAALSGASAPASPVPAPVGAHGWDETMLATFADKLSYPLVVELFDACAMSPGEWIPKAQIDGSGDPKQLRNELAAMTKLINKLFGKGFSWPIEWHKVRNQYDYRLDGETAAAWRKVRQLPESS